ncbi:MAG TPA: ABC transporter substrate-binding protein [Usitatibacter sp.]|jgi:ABC-type nitrate/sulfonate/bicarbonate transport system substrate-binding protein|nr:ABC transporter substrate-binding protein [Usitatibacter sp.]
MRRILAAILATLAAGGACAAQALNVILFPGGANWTLWVGQEKGLFAAQGLDVKLTPTPSSAYLMQNLDAGKFDIAFAAIDNVIAYQEGQGEAPLAKPAEFFAFVGQQHGGVRLYARPEIHAIADLKGKSLAVDAATTGYAFVLRKLLQQGGLGAGDYKLERLGGTGQRAQALMEGKTDATIITSPLDVVPAAKGMRRLANVVDAIGPYQGTCGITRRSWARENTQALVGFIRAYVDAMQWLADPAHRTEAVAIYRRNLPQASEEAAGKAWDALMGEREGLQKDGRLDRAGIETVLALRSEYGEPRKTLGTPEQYIDESYYDKARH